jgi:F-type H+-transporting ATPase subunit delta
MIMGSIARRYAKALFSLAVEKGRVEPWSESLQSLKEGVEGSPDLREVLSNPVYSREQRRAIVEKLAAALRLES